MAGNMKEFTKGLIKENPTLVLLLGTCPTLAISSSALDSLGMGIAATLVLVCSNAVISALKKFIPDSVRIPAFLTVIASFVFIVQMLVMPFVPALMRSVIRPGTAKTSRPCSRASRAVMDAPLRSPASTTSTPRERPLMTRFLKGKF